MKAAKGQQNRVVHIPSLAGKPFPSCRSSLRCGGSQQPPAAVTSVTPKKRGCHPGQSRTFCPEKGTLLV